MLLRRTKCKMTTAPQERRGIKVHEPRRHSIAVESVPGTTHEG
jgi:hypothetical protein